MENKKKRQSNNALNLLLSICIVSLVISILCVAIVFVCFSRVDKRLSNLEAYLGMEKVSSKSKNASEEGEISKNLEYSTIYIEGIEINYPSSGSIGEKGFHRYESDPNEYFLDIESFEFTEKSGMQAYQGSTICYDIEFIGTDYFSDTPRITFKEYDEEGYFITEKRGYLERGGIGEHVKLSGIVEFDNKAGKIMLEIEP